jgi:subtilisin family serine protease
MAKLMPIRLASQLGSQAEANAFVWAADHGADVISCSWGPEDGEWTRPEDPLHNRRAPLPDSTRLAIDYAVIQGRAGKGCVVLFAAGNGTSPSTWTAMPATTRCWPSRPATTAVGAAFTATRAPQCSDHS